MMHSEHSAYYEAVINDACIRRNQPTCQSERESERHQGSLANSAGSFARACVLLCLLLGSRPPHSVVAMASGGGEEGARGGDSGTPAAPQTRGELQARAYAQAEAALAARGLGGRTQSAQPTGWPHSHFTLLPTGDVGAHWRQGAGAAPAVSGMRGRWASQAARSEPVAEVAAPGGVAVPPQSSPSSSSTQRAAIVGLAGGVASGSSTQRAATVATPTTGGGSSTQRAATPPGQVEGG